MSLLIRLKDPWRNLVEKINKPKNAREQVELKSLHERLRAVLRYCKSHVASNFKLEFRISLNMSFRNYALTRRTKFEEDVKSKIIFI